MKALSPEPVALPALASDPRPLRVMFLDLNSYFASVEQQERPELRGRPIAVGPVMADTSFVIAASYEAKKFGIKTGTMIGDAKRMCPDLLIVPATPALYTHYHRRVLEVVETVLPIDQVCSIDEMKFRLLGAEREPDRAIELANRMKEALRDGVGECMTASIGIAPNSFLAKLATDLQKPNGLVKIEATDLPNRIEGLALTEFCGINRRTQARLQAFGIFDSTDLLNASPQQLRQAFGSVGGERWWYLLRGFEVDLKVNTGQTLGHSHVLPPHLRTEVGAHDILMRLLQKASARLRADGLWAQALTVHIAGVKNWHAHSRMPAAQDTPSMVEVFNRLWARHDFQVPRTVGITLSELASHEAITPSLFDPPKPTVNLSRAVDEVNQKFGKNSIYLAAVHEVRDSASEKIAFNKTWLFSEGKGDHEWPDTFRGPGR